MSLLEPVPYRSVRLSMRERLRVLRRNRASHTALVIIVSAALAVGLLAFLGAAGAPPASSVAPGLGAHPSGVASPATVSVPADNASGPSIFQDIWNLFSGFFSEVFAGLGAAFNTVFGAFAGGVASMFQSWGFSLGSYGIWGPVMLVVSLGIAAFVAYLMLDGIGIERDLEEGEETV